MKCMILNQLEINMDVGDIVPVKLSGNIREIK